MLFLKLFHLPEVILYFLSNQLLSLLTVVETPVICEREMNLVITIISSGKGVVLNYGSPGFKLHTQLTLLLNSSGGI